MWSRGPAREAESKRQEESKKVAIKAQEKEEWAKKTQNKLAPGRP